MSELNAEHWTLEPGVRFGLLRFGMTPEQVNAAKSDMRDADILNVEFERDRLEAIEIDGGANAIILQNLNLLELGHLECALHLASMSSNFGQSQGGSLHFEDIGLSILQFESPGLRSFIFRQNGRTSGEPLMTVSAADITAYFNEHTA